ncbi:MULTISPECIES: trans-aconitate 2-methyltransferase [unclassified Synechococcus]|uniref:class I SAM-dependent methyltransferase n=1 Tax=unclassified Synechococcus TaxID=2626047 RepID=UPI001E534AED|nr:MULTISPECIES: class I SAM-dependent methyltransferase [unclassified Synechococcus]
MPSPDPEPMPRRPEPELMDEPAQATAYAAADFAATDRLVVDRFAEILTTLTPGRCPDRLVDLGCGPGNISFLLAEQYPEAHVVGLDGAEAMLAIARERLDSRENLSATGDNARPASTGGARASDRRFGGNLEFRHLVLPCADLESPDLVQACDAVLSNSLLHHLHDPAVLWHTVRQLSAPGATVVYIKDLRRPESAAAAEDLLHRHLGQAPEVLQRDYLASLHAAFRPDEVEAQLLQAGLTGLRVAPLDDRYLEIWGQL